MAVVSGSIVDAVGKERLGRLLCYMAMHLIDDVGMESDFRLCTHLGFLEE